MVKTANVVLVGKEYIGAGYVTVMYAVTSARSKLRQTLGPPRSGASASW
jgi:hypothetical protein